MHGAELIAQERVRQMFEEGWTPEHDDEHDSFELSNAAIAYIIVAQRNNDPISRFWPWSRTEIKPKGQIPDLIKAGALIAAEIDRLQRLEAARRLCGEGGEG